MPTHNVSGFSVLSILSTEQSCVKLLPSYLIPRPGSSLSTHHSLDAALGDEDTLPCLTAFAKQGGSTRAVPHENSARQKSAGIVLFRCS